MGTRRLARNVSDVRWPAAVRTPAIEDVAANRVEEDVSEGRQDIRSPEPSLEESNPIPVQHGQGRRLWLWIGVVALIFVVVAVVVIL
ncbi:MAG: hypothetical protein IRY92_03960 [Dactylosporangium sp.]|nr:hypothetical protein [Dactylosporangium sp.]